MVQMIDLAAAVPVPTVDRGAGRRTSKRHSASGTGRCDGFRSCAARRARDGAVVVGSII
jgi:hypothetical protein